MSDVEKSLTPLAESLESKAGFSNENSVDESVSKVTDVIKAGSDKWRKFMSSTAVHRDKEFSKSVDNDESREKETFRNKIPRKPSLMDYVGHTVIFRIKGKPYGQPPSIDVDLAVFDINEGGCSVKVVNDMTVRNKHVVADLRKASENNIEFVIGNLESIKKESSPFPFAVLKPVNDKEVERAIPLGNFMGWFSTAPEDVRPIYQSGNKVPASEPLPDRGVSCNDISVVST